MQWRVVKMGSVFFDALHVYGVSIVLATLTKQPVTLHDVGLSYELTSPVQVLPGGTLDLFDELFPLPTEDQCALATKNRLQELPLTILDGLLAALLTNPIAPLKANVADLFQAQHFHPLIVAQGLQKVAGKVADWKAWIQHTAQDATNWVAEMLGDYAWNAPETPVLFAGQSKRDLHVLMTLDPSFAYSFHQAIHTGDMTQKTNVAIHGTRYAALLAFLGAARFLRSCSVAAPYLLFVVPIVECGVIEAETSLPCLSPEPVSPELALTRRLLTFFTIPVLPGCCWHSLAYQTLQQQKRQQPLCWESGYLVFSWLHQVEQEAGAEMLAFWQRCLQHGSPEEQEPLVELLKQQRPDGWYRHLTRRTSMILAAPESAFRPYRFEEVRTVTTMLDHSSSHPLRAVLNRDTEGTVCFGRALHQLGRHNPALLREFVDLLEPIRTEEALLPILRNLVAECDQAKVKWRYISVPTKQDLALLLDDIHRYGIRLVIGTVLVLSAVRYRASDEWKKYEVSTLIRVLLWLITVADSHSQEHPLQDEVIVEALVADEQFLLFSQEESDEPES